MEPNTTPCQDTISKGNCKECKCHLKANPEDDAPLAPRHSNRPSFYPTMEMLKKKKKREEESEESEESEEHEENENEELEEDNEKSENKDDDESEETIRLILEKEADKMEEKEMEYKLQKEQIHKMTYAKARKKWEIIEDQQLIKFKEREMKIIEANIDAEELKIELKEQAKTLEKKRRQLKDLYVKQLNAEFASEVDGESLSEKNKKISDKYDLEKVIEKLETEIEVAKVWMKKTEFKITELKEKAKKETEKLEEDKKCFKVAKELREKEMEEEEKGLWPGEPRWIY